LTARVAEGIPSRTPSARLRRKIELVIHPLDVACRRLINHTRMRDVLPEYFIQTHATIRATESLMEAAAERASAMADDDPVAAGVAKYLTKHVEEERDHDDWLLDDLELLGFDRATVLERLPSPTVASLVGSQYYWVYHYHPVALLGYFALMEGYPPKTEVIERWIAATGYPRQAFRTFMEHGDLDPHHRDELDEAIDSLPLTRTDEALLALSAISSVDLSARSIEEVLEEAES
jgi:Iron-containing redox enzyme